VTFNGNSSAERVELDLLFATREGDKLSQWTNPSAVDRPIIAPMLP
jgi:hypothetical protein